MNSIRTIFCLFIITISIQQASAQKLGNLLKKASDEFTGSIGDAVAKRAGDELAKIFIKKFNSKMDSITRTAYEADTSSQNISYENFIFNMDASAKVPDSYTFDLSFIIENQEVGKKDVNEMTWYCKKDGNFAGIEIEENLMVFDTDNHIMATFNNEDKTGYALDDSMLKMASAMADKEFLSYEIIKTNETKTILGYKCTKVLGTSNDNSFEAWVAEDFPLSWADAFGKIFQYNGTENLKKIHEEMNGFALESISEYDGKKYNYKVKDIKHENYTFLKSDYKFSGQ